MHRLFLKPWLLVGLVAASLGAASCSKDGDGVVLFSVQDDITLGDKVARQTDSLMRVAPNQYGRLLDRSSNAQAYDALDKVVNTVLNNGKLTYRNEFAWDVKIVQKDEKNAFATPGGHIYVYTGLIKYLDHESQLAGVLGHEIAHADRRHTSKQLQTQYGIDILLSLVLGNNPNQLAQIAAGLGQLKFSRDAESEADQYSVIYLQSTPYTCDGAAGFFIKAQSEGATNPPAFLSTHPDPDNRIAAIQNKAKELSCQKSTESDANLATLKRVLP
ncbi:M48 family metalloprotease [Hymenobacter chitinivorans]|uniref:Peptidase M48-like protein n=1 Tax=Hymenobacter chitinivorans DSM 11115 TaxID=1121954 RepID=A0A2M9BQV1_9BACT|nr:M48 family metalloprotease [Hymenobacter chitinivorans]PJJ60336.1 peptidase M48-like protein [Hymenobacter chitinivorans DSM 11115]